MTVLWSDDLSKAEISRIARATIAALEKRIAELELQSKQWQETFERCLDDMADERQRRESAEAALRPFASPPLQLDNGRTYQMITTHSDNFANARAHFSRYPSGSDDPPK